MKMDKYNKEFIEIINSIEFTIGKKKVAEKEWIKTFFSFLMPYGYWAATKHRIFFIGNGASSSMASHFATDFTKNGKELAYAITDSAELTCFSNDFGFENCYAEILKRKMYKDDILIAISSSGESKNIINAIGCANHCYSATFTGFKKSNTLRKIGYFNCYVPANTYGMVESAHAFILHKILDLWVKENGNV